MASSQGNGFWPMLRKFCVALAMLPWLITPSLADTPLELQGNAESFPLDTYLTMRDDPTGSLTLEAAVTTEFTRAHPRGLAPGTLWYRFQVVRPALAPARWLLSFGEADIDDARVYIPLPSGGFQEIALGLKADGHGPVPGMRLNVAPLDLPADRIVTIYLRLSTDRKLRFENAALWRPEALVVAEAREAAGIGVSLGLLLCIAMISCTVGLWLRDGVVLAYGTFVATQFCGTLAHSGMLTLLFPSASDTLNHTLQSAAHIGSVSTFLLMWSLILDLRQHFPKVFRAYIALAAFMLLLLPWSLGSNFHPMIMAANWTMLAAGLTNTLVALMLLRRHPRELLLWLYLAAFLPFLPVAGSQIADMIWPSLVSEGLGRALHLVLLRLHVGLLCLVLAYRIRAIQKEKLRVDAVLAGERLSMERLKNFVNMATHEFKTPLTVIDSAAQVLGLLVPDTPETSRRLTVIRRSVTRLVKLIETCLSVERSENLALLPRPISPEAVLAGAAERNTDADGALIAVRDVDAPAEILADPDLLGMALDALIDNARRYDPSNQAVELSVSSEADRVRFAVADRGPGVRGREKELIFEKYYRSSSADRIAGTGLGLHLVKTIAHLHGGEVSYRDRPDGGAIFVLSIPVAGPPA